MTALVFGLGYIGAALVQRLWSAGETVVGLDSGFATDLGVLEQAAGRYPQQFELVNGDIRQRHDVAHGFERAQMRGPIRAVFHLAAQASGHAEAATAEFTEETNLRGARYVLEGARDAGNVPVVYASSFHVYGAGPQGVVDEDHPYGAQRDLSHLSKIYVEKLGEMLSLNYGVPFAPVRLGIVYGVGPITKQDLRFVTVPHAFCLRALAGQPLEVRSAAPAGFIHLDDAVEALLAARPKAGYLPANAVSEVTTVAEVARLVRLAAGRGDLAEPDVPPSGTFQVSSRLDHLGWQPRLTLAQTVPAIFDHYAAQQVSA